MNHFEQSDVAVLKNEITSISLATNVLHLMCMKEQGQTSLCTIQRQVACFRLSMEQLRHPLNSYRIIMNPQTQALLIPPPLVCPSNPSSNWLLYAIYASPDLALHTELWDDLASFASSHNLPLLLAGDFNKNLHQHETHSNSPPNRRRIPMFNDLLTNCNLMDLGYCGPRFTWTNKRDNGLVMKRLDRALANP
nr:hypothetical protein CFP56_31321 [Quercus suber]